MLLGTVPSRRRAIASTVSMVSFDVDGTLFRKAALHQAAGPLGIREEWDGVVVSARICNLAFRPKPVWGRDNREWQVP
jgi:hypothetical protein